MKIIHDFITGPNFFTIVSLVVVLWMYGLFDGVRTQASELCMAYCKEYNQYGQYNPFSEKTCACYGTVLQPRPLGFEKACNFPRLNTTLNYSEWKGKGEASPTKN